MPFADVNGFRMHYEETGSGRPIILQPGWVSNEMIWAGVVPHLRDSYRCVVLETRGTGQSEHTGEGHSISQYADDLLALADHLGLDRFSIAGHSMGGIIATEVALKTPARLENIVYVASTADSAFVPQPVWDMLFGLGDQMADGNKEAAAGFFMGICARRDGVPFDLAAEAAVACHPGYIRDSIRSAATYSPGDAVASIATPALIVGGSSDVFLGAAIATHTALPNTALHVFNRASHVLPIDVGPELAAVIDDFMQHGVVTAESLMAG